MSVLLALAISLGVAAGAIAVFLLVRAAGPPEGLWADPEPGHSAAALSILGSAFTLLAAFVMFLAFQSFQNAERSADSEASATQRLFHSADVFPDPLRDDLHGAAACYSRAVIHDEWPKMRDVQQSRLVERWGLAMQEAAERVDFDSPRGLAAYEEFLELDRERADNRRERLEEAAPFVPGLLWTALIAAEVLLLFSLCLFATRGSSRIAQTVLLGGIALVATLILCVIRYLDKPYEGVAGSITPSSMQEASMDIDRTLERRFPELRVPCDEVGNPTDPQGS